MNESAHAALQAQIDRLRAAPEKLLAQAPDIAINVLKKSLKETIAAGQAPDGTAWKQTLAGGTPLTHAFKALAFTKAGSGILIKLTGPEALHHLGRAKGEIIRRIIPVGDLPPHIAARLIPKLQELCAKVLSG